MTIASGALFAPRTISSSRMTLAGLKKCVPTTSCGREVAPAISSTSSVEVLVASSAPGLAIRSSSANTVFLTAMSSNTASITTSASARGVEADGAGNQPQAPLHLLGAKSAARHCRAVIGGDPVAPLLQQVVAGLDHRHRNDQHWQNTSRCRRPSCRHPRLRHARSAAGGWLRVG